MSLLLILLISSAEARVAAPNASGPILAPTIAPRQELAQAMRIRVRLAEALPRFVARGFDLSFFSIAPRADRRLASQSDRVSEWEFRCVHGEVLGTQRGGTRSVRLPSPVQIESPAGFLSFQSKSYREKLWVHAIGSGCEVVNEVEIEKYLDGLVNVEFNADWNEEAIVAQVVAARTYAVYQLRHAGMGRHFDVDATTRDQVYDGSFREDFRSARSVNRARGVILAANQDSKSALRQPIKAFYHSTCGGRTELPQAVWGSPMRGFERRVVCPYCASAPRFRWEIELSAGEIQQALRKGALKDRAMRSRWTRDEWRAIQQGILQGLRVLPADSSKRAHTVEVVFQLGARKIPLTVSGARFRDWLGAARLRSAWFEASVTSPGRWALKGRGNGHGVGLCQWGAKRMGEQGFKAAAILNHYYPGATLLKLW